MNFPVLVTLGVVATILVYVIVVSTQAWFRYEFQHEYQKKVVNQPHVWLNDVRDKQLAELQNGPVPIDEAMQRVVARYEAGGDAAGSQAGE